MSNKYDHKVVIVLDHGPKVAVEVGEVMSLSLKDATAGEVRTVGHVRKSLWTWTVESAMEMHRVVNDLFAHEQRLMRLVVSDNVSRMLQPEWGTNIIDPHELANSLSSLGEPSTSQDTRNPHDTAITLAIEALSRLTTYQLSGITQATAPLFKRQPFEYERENRAHCRIRNCGSIVIFTAFHKDEEVDNLIAAVAEIIQSRNKVIAILDDENFARLEHVKLFVINAVVSGSSVKPRKGYQACRELSCDVFSKDAGECLIEAAHGVALSIYNLVSTTVSGIPMKEETQAMPAQSVNYDVELLHSRKAHEQLASLGLIDRNGALLCSSNGCYNTTRLSWATPSPRSKWNLFPRSTCAVRMTPALVNSRPTVCLTSFLTQGRNVMLEVAREGAAAQLNPNVSQKLISHTLIAHNGRLYIHSIDICDDSWDNEQMERAVPAKTAGVPRVNDMINLIRECMLSGQVKGAFEKPCFAPRRHLARITRYFPLRQDDSFIFNLPTIFEPILSLIRQKELTTADIDKCKQVIEKLMKARNNDMPITYDKFVCRRFDILNRDMQFTEGVNEMVKYLCNYANHSPRHLDFLNLFVQTLRTDRPCALENTSDVLLNEDDLKGYIGGKATASKSTSSTSITSTGPPSPKKPKMQGSAWLPNEVINLYDWLVEKYNREHPRTSREFYGLTMLKAGTPVKLYANIIDNPPPPKNVYPAAKSASAET